MLTIPQRFHFRTRRQELNSVEGGNRVNNDYLDQLAKFHKTHGHSLNRFPSVDKRPLDLYRLKKTVERKGGFDAVCRGKRWAEVGRDLGYSGKIMSSLSTSLKNSYQKWLLPYEDYLRLAKPGVQHQLEIMNGGPFTPSPGPSPSRKSRADTPAPAKEETPALRASSALHANINGDSLPQHSSLPENLQPLPPSTAGFTPVNAGGGFTAVNAQTPTESFTSVNGANGLSHPTNATPPLLQTPVANNGPVAIAPHPNGIAALKRQHSDGILTQEEIDAIGRRSKRLRRDAPTVAGSNMHHSRMGASRAQSGKERSNYAPGDMCEGCGKADDPDKRVICESCESAYHLYCLDPPQKQRPDCEWHCPRCLVGTNEYGFEDGDVYSLSGFQRKANEFKVAHFANIPRQFRPPGDGKNIHEEDIEREFWRLVEDMNDTVEVEYGADIHSTTHGSGFPTIEKQPRDPYSTDPWNLNILPLDKESLFRHIKSDVSGMTVPWLYVGMVFSTFCWHNEDHFSYSANYQHFGDTKTWYGIPGEDSYRFEEAMRDEVPELFEMQPDLLFQLVTLAKPEKLRKAGVRVYAIDQHAGQFVVTYPRAYHAGFNHGFNFNEAVNFAPADWEPFGEEGVKRLRDYRKQPCFSHDELLLTAASGSYNIKTAKWLAPALERMRANEVYARNQFLAKGEVDTIQAQDDVCLGPRYQGRPEIIDPTQEDDEVICTSCKAYCYLSRFVCAKSKKVMCLLHAGTVDCCDAMEVERYSGRNGDHVLHYRMSDEQLNATVRKVVDKASIPESWMAKVDAELDDNPRPSLKHLRTFLTEGEKIQYDLPQLPDLKRFVERCNEWVEEATNYITRKQQNRRKTEKAWRKSTAKATELEERDKELRNVENIRKLLETADSISFDCPEITTLRERAESISEFQRDANIALEDVQANSLQEFEELVERGKDFHVDIPEIDLLERLLKRLRWNEMARLKRPTVEYPRQNQTLQDIERFIQDGLDIGVPEDNLDIAFFREHKVQGEMWEQKAQELMAAEHVHFQQLDALSRQATTLPVSADTLARVDSILKKQREVQEKILELYEQTKDPDFRNRPMYRDVRDVMSSLEELQSKPGGTIDLEREQRRHEDWMRRGKKLFGKANAPLHILHQHMQIVEARNESCFDLRDKPRMPVEPSSRANSPEEGLDRAADGSSSSRDVFCICRRPEAGMMIECELCHEWYHGKCLKIARGKVKEDDKYTCPVCDWRVKIPRDAARPKLEDLQQWQDELDILPFQPEEEETLNNIVSHGQAFRDFLRPYINPIATSPEEVGTLRFHLRKIEGADILLSEETNFLRQELHKWAPVAPLPPPVIEASQSTRKPRPTKQQKIMAQLGITNPDDLPQQYKIRPHIAKRKASEALAKNMPLQPAGHGSSSPAPPGAQSLGAPQGAPKPGLTALAIQVLGNLASNPVAMKMLAAEPHMNREKLEKMRVLLSQDPALGDDVESFTAKMAALPHMPAFGYEINHKGTPTITSSSFRDQSTFSATSSGSARSPTAQSQLLRLGSPATFAPAPSFPRPASPPSPHFGASMFDNTTGASSMFDSPGVGDPKSSMRSPDYGLNARGLFGSPNRDRDSSGLIQAGLQSPGFGGNQPYPYANSHPYTDAIDNVFGYLESGHEPVPGLDGANDDRDLEHKTDLLRKSPIASKDHTQAPTSDLEAITKTEDVETAAGLANGSVADTTEYLGQRQDHDGHQSSSANADVSIVPFGRADAEGEA